MTQSQTQVSSRVILSVSDLHKSYDDNGEKIKVFDGFDLELRDGGVMCILGRSGCGKSTLLKCIAGIEGIDSGEVSGDVTDVGYVFQEDRLLNWKTVDKNIRLALSSKGIPQGEHDERIERYLDLVDLSEHSEKYPLQLSGGMRQRVSLARALAIEPDVLLMDEPFSNLDEITAHELREILVDLINNLDQSVIFITHNAEEAAFISTEVVVLKPSLPTDKIAHIQNPLAHPRDIHSEEIFNLKMRILDNI